MPPESRDDAYLWDILDAARRIEEFMENITLAEYERDRKLQLAIERLLEIIGEASRRLSQNCRSSNGQIPWAGMIGLRNVLAHEYGEIRNDMIWRVATHRIGVLISGIEALKRRD